MLIIFEGGEGVGKSTQINLLNKALLDNKLPIVKTREPGGTPFAEKIRTLFKEKTDDSPTSLTELYLICAARAQHLEKFITPMLSLKKIILCDRFLDSTYVYQHILGGVPKQLIDNFTHPILQGLLPDLTFIFHCDKNIALNRIKSEENRSCDRLDSYDVHMHKTILNGYKKIFDDCLPYPCGKVPKRVLIDASVSVDAVFTQIKSAFHKYLGVEL